MPDQIGKNGQVDAPMRTLQAWRSKDIGGREAFTHRLSGDHIDALGRLVQATRNLAPDAVTRAQFSCPLIDDLMDGVRAQIQWGYGVVILSGLPMNDLSVEDFTRIHWGLGTHLGTGAIQNLERETIVKIKREPDGPSGVTADFELKPHCDFHEILSLAAVSLPARGGVSGLVSGLAIHERIAQTRPDLLPALYEGYWQASPVDRSLSRHRTPVFSQMNGVWSVYFNRLFQGRAAEVRGEALPAALAAALEVFTACAEDPDLAAHFTLQPGEQMFWNNFVNLHSRTAFEDSADHVRLLLRLFIRPYAPRPVVEAVAERAAIAEREYGRGRADAAQGVPA